MEHRRCILPPCSLCAQEREKTFLAMPRKASLTSKSEKRKRQQAQAGGAGKTPPENKGQPPCFSWRDRGVCENANCPYNHSFSIKGKGPDGKGGKGGGKGGKGGPKAVMSTAPLTL